MMLFQGLLLQVDLHIFLNTYLLSYVKWCVHIYFLKETCLKIEMASDEQMPRPDLHLIR